MKARASRIQRLGQRERQIRDARALKTAFLRRYRSFFVSCSMENQPKIRAATDELAVLEFEIDALQSRHNLLENQADLAVKQQRALDLYAALYELRNALDGPPGGNM